MKGELILLAVLELIKAIKYLADNDFGGTDDVLNAANRIAGGPKSIAQMARENICQFPLLMSDNISIQAGIQTANVLEQLYTTYIKMVITNNAEILDLSRNQDKKKNFKYYPSK